MVETLDAVHVMFDLGPGCPDAELQSSAREVVDRHRQLGQQGWIPVRVASNHGAETHPAGCLRDRRLQRPTLVDRAVGADGADRGQVVEDPDVVEACLVGDLPDIAERLDRGVLPGVL